jgi:hypothetical protein
LSLPACQASQIAQDNLIALPLLLEFEALDPAARQGLRQPALLELIPALDLEAD